MRNTISFLKPYKLSMIIAFSLMVFELIVELLLPFFLGKMINSGIMQKDIETVIMWGSIMLGMAFLSFIAGIINSFYASHTSFGFAYDIRKKLYEKVQSYSFANLQRFPTSGLVTRFTNDVRQIQNTIFMGLRIMSKAPLLIVGGVIMAFVVNARLALIFLVTVPLLVGFLLWVLKIASNLFNKLQQLVDTVNRVMQENLIGMRLIKAFFRRNFEEKRFHQANKALADTTRFTFRFVESSMPVLLFIMNLSLIFILWFGNKQVLAGSTNVGDVVAIVNYAMRVAMFISMFSFIIMAFSRAKASAERLDQVLVETVDLVDHPDASEENMIMNGKIEFQDVSFRYPMTDENILKHLTFTIHPQEKLAVLGATGSGKTSFFQLIPRLYNVTNGEIFMDDKPISAFTLEHLRNSIGYVPQSPILFSGTLADNIAWGKKNATKEEIIQAAKDAQIHDTIINLPDGYETLVGQRGVNLSGGQKQRISIARALIRRPKLLLFDDSTSALDLATEAKLLERLDTYHSTMLMITQKISTARSADRIMLMEQGEILQIGTHEELLQHSKLYRDIVMSQYGKEYGHAN
ncbi:ABC transporter ATP-binding protein [Cerasibacillus terrae]|uniref:ABC transporter ATP-binding protein n=1 Tax=Cerasibacillus terrae TaxID=2498845 RepID=A0A5C8NQR8_9BACI|nr:ABC transporter ATP-binding protein [Cerasibacillus terrae]TXL64094.1 ABC transporter ATP-binding protein [Cerasibacillus terrae]